MSGIFLISSAHNGLRHIHELSLPPGGDTIHLQKPWDTGRIAEQIDVLQTRGTRSGRLLEKAVPSASAPPRSAPGPPGKLTKMRTSRPA